jgi:hypothetical protein
MPSEFNPTLTTNPYSSSATSDEVAGDKSNPSNGTNQSWFEFWQEWACTYVSGTSSIDFSAMTDGSAVSGASGVSLDIPVAICNITAHMQRQKETWYYSAGAYEEQTLILAGSHSSGIGAWGTISTDNTGYIRRLSNPYDSRVLESHSYQAIVPIPGDGADALTNYRTLIHFVRKLSAEINRKSYSEGQGYTSPEGVAVSGLYMPTLLDVF